MENDVSINFSKEALEEIEFPRGAFMMSEQTASHTNTAQDMSFTSDPHVLGPTNVELVLLTSNVIDANHHSDLAVKHPWSLPSDAESTERTPFLSGHQTNHDNAIFQHDVSFQGDLSAMEDLQIPDNITVDHGPGNLTSLQRLNKGVSIDRTVPDSGPEFQQGVVNFHSDLYSFIGLQEVNSFNPTLQIEDVNVSQRHDQTSAFNAIDSDIVRIHHANQVHDASLVAEVHPIDNRGALRFTSIGLIPIPVARTKQFTRRIEKKGKNVVKHRHSLHNWNHVFETSNVFWKHMGYTSEEVAAILTVIYDFPIS